MRVAGYIRVSTDKEGQKESPENQKRLIQKFLIDNKYDFYDFYTDVKSGTTDNREGLKRLIKDAEEKRFDIIVMKELSRMGRNVELLYQLKRITESKGVRLISLDGMVDTDDVGKLAMFGLYAWMCESESQRTSDRIKSVFKMKFQTGKYMGSFPPYGYRNLEGKLFVRDDDTPEIVRDIYRKYLSGWGHDKIARYLSKQGLDSPATLSGRKNANKFWSGSSVRGILTNVHYVGDIAQGRQTTISATNKKRKNINPDEWIILPDMHEGIISREIFEQAQRLTIERKKIGQGIKNGKHLFTNFVYCADCKKGMWFKSNREGYLCGNYVKHGRMACTHHAITEESLAEAVLSDLKSMFEEISRPEYEKKLDKKITKMAETNKKKLAQINNQIEKQDNLRVNALEKFIGDEISKSDYENIISVISNRTAELDLEKAEYNQSEFKQLEIDKQILSSIIESVINFETLTREMLFNFVERIEITEDRNVKITYKFKQMQGNVR